jgi:gamma-glutamyl-gamma-aminobutyrate hydrolase PuuD
LLNEKDKKILVPSTFFPGRSYANFALRALSEHQVEYNEHKFFQHPGDYKLVVFTGGEDVTPELYGETSPKKVCCNNEERDSLERRVFNIADQHRIKMYGICRGTQIINVLLGGKMMHHVNGHGGVQHDITLASGNVVPATVSVNSLHHQMCVPSLHTHILAWSTKRLSNVYVGDKDEEMLYHGPEVEAIYNPNFKCLGVQWHPEIDSVGTQGRQMSLQMLKDFMTMETGGFMKKYLPDASKTYVTIQRPR